MCVDFDRNVINSYYEGYDEISITSAFFSLAIILYSCGKVVYYVGYKGFSMKKIIL